MVRIRYYSVGNLLYTDWFTLGPNFIVRGIINTENLTYQICELNSEIVIEGTGYNLRNVKSIMRAEFVKMGLNFEGEIRRTQ
jgi:hypothetical protein